MDLLEEAGVGLNKAESETGDCQVQYPLADAGAPTVRPSMIAAFAAMEDDDPMGEMVRPEVQQSLAPTPTKDFPPSTESTAHLDDSERITKLFPNSFKVAGIKHVCDNALSSILKSLPKFPDPD